MSSGAPILYKEPTRDELREMAKLSPVAWAMYASEGKWKRSRHLLWLSQQLLRLERGEIKRLIVSMPPRHGKSEMISKYFPTWWMGTHPSAKVISCSYGEALTKEWSRAARDAFSESGPACFDLDTWSRSSAGAWDTYRYGRRTGGGLRAVGKGGALTGRGADLLICDDLIRDAQEANNPLLRQGAWDWFVSVPLTRLEPGGRAIVVMTRWHHDDILGRLMAQQAATSDWSGEPWEIINLPAIAEEGDALGRAPGEALWPERYPIPELEKIRADVGPYVWGALYQGQPTPTEGALFKREWLHSYKLGVETITVPGRGTARKDTLTKYCTIDLAASVKARADYTVIAVWGFHREWGVLLLLDLVRVRLDGPDILPRIRETMQVHEVGVGFVESIGFQATLIQAALREGIPLRELRPVGDKVTRAMPATAVMEQSLLLLPEGASWRGEFEAELLQFPEGKHDDQVDALSYGVQVFLEKTGRGAPTKSAYPRGGGGGWKLGR